SLYLNDLVVCGEIINTKKNSVHGWLYLCDRDVPLPLQLTGNCAPDLAGRHIRFEARRPHPAEDSAAVADSLASQQVGPTGVITASRRVRVFDDLPGAETAPARSAKARWKRCLFLEWFSQNGRVVVELVDPRIEFIEDDDTHDATSDEDSDAEVLDISADELDELDRELEDLADSEIEGEEEEEDDDPYGLFTGEDGITWRGNEEEDDDNPSPDGLGSELLARLAEDDETMRELELMDALIERGAEVPVGSIFDPPIKLPRPEGLNDEQVEIALRTLLAELARYGIALDMCEHFTARQAYQLLLDEICVDEGAFPELRGTQWVQHFMTHDFCPVCQAEYAADDPPEAGTDESPDDDLPF
ncbi:MAG: hypothetical protein KDA42_08795, partial [Planctomycetales bacterium]|nr:hypothetical protein [Planctomycetales bacterium]